MTRTTDDIRIDSIRYETFKEQSIDLHDIWTHRITICVGIMAVILAVYCLHWGYEQGMFSGIYVVEN